LQIRPQLHEDGPTPARLEDRLHSFDERSVRIVVECPHVREDESRQLARYDFLEYTNPKSIHEPTERRTPEIEDRKNGLDGEMVVEEAESRQVLERSTHRHLSDRRWTEDHHERFHGTQSSSTSRVTAPDRAGRGYRDQGGTMPFMRA
jgi:hypothetical protein